MTFGRNRFLLIGVVVTAACGRSAPQVDLLPIAAQNVLLITIDTLRADALSCYGGPAATRRSIGSPPRACVSSSRTPTL